MGTVVAAEAFATAATEHVKTVTTSITPVWPTTTTLATSTSMRVHCG